MTAEIQQTYNCDVLMATSWISEKLYQYSWYQLGSPYGSGEQVSGKEHPTDQGPSQYQDVVLPVYGSAC